MSSNMVLRSGSDSSQFREYLKLPSGEKQTLLLNGVIHEFNIKSSSDRIYITYHDGNASRGCAFWDLTVSRSEFMKKVTSFPPHEQPSRCDAFLRELCGRPPTSDWSCLSWLCCCFNSSYSKVE